MAQKLKPFGEGSMGYEHGYTLPLLSGWLDDLVATESERAEAAARKGPLQKRLTLVEDAAQKLQEAIELFEEEE